MFSIGITDPRTLNKWLAVKSVERFSGEHPPKPMPARHWVGLVSAGFACIANNEEAIIGIKQLGANEWRLLHDEELIAVCPAVAGNLD